MIKVEHTLTKMDGTGLTAYTYRYFFKACFICLLQKEAFLLSRHVRVVFHAHCNIHLLLQLRCLTNYKKIGLQLTVVGGVI